MTMVTSMDTCSSSILQLNIDDSNTDGLFSSDDSNCFLSPYEILPIAQENKYMYLEICFYFVMKLYVCMYVCIRIISSRRF